MCHCIVFCFLHSKAKRGNESGGKTFYVHFMSNACMAYQFITQKCFPFVFKWINIWEESKRIMGNAPLLFFFGKLKRKNTNFQSFNIRVDDPVRWWVWWLCVCVCWCIKRTHVGLNANPANLKMETEKASIYRMKNCLRLRMCLSFEGR